MRLSIFLAALMLALSACRSDKREKHTPSQAGPAFLWWNLARSFPDGQFHTERYMEALAQRQFEAQLRGGFDNAWEAIGPNNIGGRTLCLAVHPLDTNILWVGSASGGIWKSNTAGRGVNAWQRVETGFPVLGVSALAIDPENPDVLYAGTGEVYNVEESAPNVAFRTTRGTYGIGILKSTDGGAKWSKCLDWGYGELRGVQDIKLNPKRSATVYAATSEGLLRSYDAGATWKTVLDKRMAVDIELHPSDTNRIFVTCGSLDDQDVSGVYRSVDAGNTFAKLAGGLPATYTGKTLLAISPNVPNTVYASMGDAFAQKGLYKTTNGGDNWIRISGQDVCTYQGWYSHDVAVNPLNPNILIWVGIDTWKSVNGGSTVSKKSYWNKWYFGEVPAGEPEGPFDYVHADIHRVYYVRQDPNKIYLVTDGGIFVSYNGGESFSGRNGGYQTQQFYANMGHSATNPNISIGGMQDNSTAIYSGKPSWRRVLGGDGECAAISPADDKIMYGSSQYLNFYKSTNGGQNFYGIGSPEINSEEACFNGPFELAPSNPDIMYAGAQRLHRSEDAGETFTPVTEDLISEGDLILSIGVSPSNPDLVYCSTAPNFTDKAQVFKVDLTADSMVTPMQGLPNRLCMDIAVHPQQDDIVYAAFGGFNTAHLYRTTDGGATWLPVDQGLPDVPTNSILIDPLQPDHIYIGNDLGVWLSTDAAASWSLYSAQGPQAMLAMHLGLSADRKLRVGTYGLGVWQTAMAFVPVSAKEPRPLAKILALSPNPATDVVSIRFEWPVAGPMTLQVLDATGRMVRSLPSTYLSAGTHARSVALDGLPAGMYGVRLRGKGVEVAKLIFKQ